MFMARSHLALAVAIACTNLLIFCHPAASQSASNLTDDQIREAIIAQSIAEYPGNCPCPYNRAANGSKCGKRSAWSRAGGYAPICYPQEVTEEMIAQYRSGH
jgi:hypothetical protein